MCQAKEICNQNKLKGRFVKDMCNLCRIRNTCQSRIIGCQDRIVNAELTKDISALNKCIDEGRFNPRRIGGVR